MAKTKKATPPKKVTAGLPVPDEAPALRPGVTADGVRIPHDLDLTELSNPRVQDRWAPATKYGGIGVEGVAGILAAAETGPQYQSQDLYEWMIETDPHIASTYGTRLMGLAALKWDVEPASGGNDNAEEANRAADFVRECLQSIPGFRRSVHELADGIGKGYAVQEIMWGRAGNAWRPTELKWRHQRRFTFGVDWDLRLHDMGIHGVNGCALPPAKYLVHIPKQRAGYPTRTAALRSVAFHWVFKRWATKFWLTGAERFGMPTPWAIVPPKTPKETMTAIREAMDRLTQGQSGVIKDGTTLNFLPAGSVNTTIYQDLVSELNNDMTKAMLGSASNVDAQANGSRAASESQASVTIDPRIAYDADALEGTINEQLVKYIIDFNWHMFGGKRPPMPRFTFLLSEDSRTPLDAALLSGKLVTRDEVRISNGLDPAGGEFGSEFLNVQAAPSAPAAFGGKPPDAPLAVTMATRNGSTPRTFSPSRMTPLERALSEPLADLPSFQRKPS